MVASNGQLFKEKTQKIPPKPTVLEVIPENIPPELKAIPNWMCWCYELASNNQGEWKWTKPPLQVNSRYARSDQPRTWTTYERVLEHYLSPFGTEPNGIGFRPTGDVIGSDLDHCRDPVTGRSTSGRGRSSALSTATPKSARAGRASASSATGSSLLGGGRTATSRCTTRAARSI